MVPPVLTAGEEASGRRRAAVPGSALGDCCCCSPPQRFRNSDYFTTSEISESEYNEINKKYPKEIIANREKAEVFRNKYVDGHPVILEGWDRLL